MRTIPTYQVDALTLSEIETLERALMTYQNYIRKNEYDNETRNGEQENINSLCTKLREA